MGQNNALNETTNSFEVPKSQDVKLEEKHKQRGRTKSPYKEVLRVPRKSEMAYFGVPISPKPVKKSTESKLSEKPDLLQFNSKERKSREVKNLRNIPATIKQTKKSSEPIYENIEELKRENQKKYKREFDSSILDELTKAADQIMQAVNGYTDEDSHNKISSDDEEKKKEQLDTISETKSLKIEKLQQRKAPSKNENPKVKLKPTSSTSSIESFTRECKISSTPVRKANTSIKTTERQRKKIVNSDTTSSKASTKARRLQRANSREALLQSHGSSSEDLAATIEVPLRKPRLVKKTKTTQLTITNGIELHKRSEKSIPMTKRREDSKNKNEER